ncbi:hypothetical protein HOY34_12990 [Xinfangfangia sp. D13-10-4-6]|uniref:dynamin family protein n=1 Tax=Pseudogemmobacter hezensis TaxID=2737662 RepID=UPI0015548314|nr:dynamin family protein [Pseudogemmobacter hezensis]NPD16115.1 hypothetical protein [Pseudogemmobacter hezensis]
MAYDQIADRIVSPAALARLTERANAPPRLAVSGEFSSGKSTLLNLLLGQDILPIRATATALPSVWISYGDREGHFIDANGRQQPLPSEGIDWVPSNARYIRLYVIADVLKDCEIIDLAGLSDPDRPDSVIQEMLSYASLAIWCTPATQAWRQSERAAWLTVPARIRANSILAVTRSDKLRNAQERDRVMRRVCCEADGLFAAATPISAMQAKIALENADDDGFAESGIDQLASLVTAQIDRIRGRRLRLLDRYIADDTRFDVAVAEAADATADVCGDDADFSMPLILRDPAPEFELTPEIVSEIAQLPEADHSAQAEMPDLSVCFDDPAPLIPSQAEAEPAAPAEALVSSIEAAIQRVMSGYFTADTKPQAAVAAPHPAPPGAIPRETMIWREIVAGSDVSPRDTPVIDLIDQLLTRLFNEKGQ